MRRRRAPSLLRAPRRLFVSGVGAVLGDQGRSLPVECSIGWQPSVFTPVFYGHRDYTVRLPFVPDVVATALARPSPGAEVPGITARLRAFYPSLDGAPVDAPLLSHCGRYPLVVFAHGHCGEPDHFQKWFELAATLARCGNVVLYPSSPRRTAEPRRHRTTRRSIFCGGSSAGRGPTRTMRACSCLIRPQVSQATPSAPPPPAAS